MRGERERERERDRERERERARERDAVGRRSDNEYDSKKTGNLETRTTRAAVHFIRGRCRIG